MQTSGRMKSESDNPYASPRMDRGAARAPRTRSRGRLAVIAMLAAPVLLLLAIGDFALIAHIGYNSVPSGLVWFLGADSAAARELLGILLILLSCGSLTSALIACWAATGALRLLAVLEAIPIVLLLGWFYGRMLLVLLFG
jgi:hypothetical protein